MTKKVGCKEAAAVAARSCPALGPAVARLRCRGPTATAVRPVPPAPATPPAARPGRRGVAAAPSASGSICVIGVASRSDPFQSVLRFAGHQAHLGKLQPTQDVEHFHHFLVLHRRVAAHGGRRHRPRALEVGAPHAAEAVLCEVGR